MTRHRFSVSISAEECLSFYQGEIKQVVVRSTTGLRISIPVQNFLPFVTYSGIQGFFEVAINSSNKIVEFTKL